MTVSSKMNSIGNFCWLGKSQLTLLLVLINFISAAFHACKVVYVINEFCIQMPETVVAKSQPNVSPQVCNINCFTTSFVFSFFGGHILKLHAVVNN